MTGGGGGGGGGGAARKPEDVVEEWVYYLADANTRLLAAVFSPRGLATAAAGVVAAAFLLLFLDRRHREQAAALAAASLERKAASKERSKQARASRRAAGDRWEAVADLKPPPPAFGAEAGRREAEEAEEREERRRVAEAEAEAEMKAAAVAVRQAAWAAEQARERAVALEDRGRGRAWTSEQDAALVAALRLAPREEGETAAVRMGRVAALVPGRGVRECVERVRELKGESSRQQAREEVEAADLFGGGGGAGAGGSGGSSDASDVDPGSDSDSDDSAMGERMAMELEPEHCGTQLLVAGLQLVNIATAQPEDLRVQVACARCGAESTVHLSGAIKEESEYKAWCAGCRCIMQLTLRPCLMHAAAATLGYVDCFACEVVDLLPSNLLVTCMECSAPQVLPPFTRNERQHAQCHGCHTKMIITVAGVEVRKITEAMVGGAGGGGGRRERVHTQLSDLEARLTAFKGQAKAAERALGFVLAEGSPLPKSGACSHFRRSLKWFRFPCCGRTFPCPTCHEASGCPAVEAGGGGVWATRMLCGKCSREQPTSNKACSGCGFDCGTGASKSHWQGGAGMRDMSRLAKKDARHRDNRWDKGKTVSRKAAAKAGLGKGKKKG